MKLQRLKKVLALVLTALFFTTWVYAQDRLDGPTIQRWADSMAELQAWGEDLDDDDDLEIDDPMDFERSLAQAAREHAEVRRIVARHGFRDGDHWAGVGGRIMNAYWALMMQDEAPEMHSEMQRQIEEIEQNPHLSREQKEMMRNQMEQAMGMMGRLAEAPPADIAAVRANRERLDRLFEDE